MSYLNGDPRRPNKVHRYTPSSTDSGDDPTIEFMSFLGTFGNARASDDVKHLATMAVLAVCVLVMSYFHNPAPLTIQI